MAVAAGRQPGAGDFVRLKLRLLRNGFRGQAWRVVAFALGTLFAAWLAAGALLGLAATGWYGRDVGYVVATFAGTVVVLGWVLVPLLFFGVDETLDPARFALLPLPRMTIARGMLAAAFVGVPAAATLLATMGLVLAAGLRFGPTGAAVGLVGVLVGLVLSVVASRAVASAFAAVLRSRRVRDLAAVTIALLASSLGPLQWVVVAAARHGSVGQATGVAEIIAWTPLAAPYVLPYDVADGRWPVALVRLGLTLVTIAALLWWWSRTIEGAMLGASTGGVARRDRPAERGAVAALIPRALRWAVRPGMFGAILARESRFWWRDGRRRASLVSILGASAVLPVVFHLAAEAGSRPVAGGVLPFSFAVTMAGTMGGMLLGNQFAFDGSAYATHLMGPVPGRLELRARVVAIAVVAVPLQLAVLVAVTWTTGRPQQLPTGLGVLAASFGSAIAIAALLSVLAPYPLPDSANPFALNSGGTSAKGMLALVAMLATFVVTMPVVVAASWLSEPTYGAWVVAALGLAYGIVAAVLGTFIAGDVLDRRGPEILAAVSLRQG